MEKIALALGLVGVLNFFGSSNSLKRSKGMSYFLLALCLHFFQSGLNDGQEIMALCLLVGTGFLYILYGLKQYLESSQSTKMEDLNDFDD